MVSHIKKRHFTKTKKNNNNCVTHDMWQVKHKTLYVTTGRRWTFAQNFSSLALMVWEFEVPPDMWHLTPGTWHMTHTIWHVSHDTQEVGKIVSKIQVPICNDLGVMMLWRYFHKVWGCEWMNQWINDKGVHRTAPATPGL